MGHARTGHIYIRQTIRPGVDYCHRGGTAV